MNIWDEAAMEIEARVNTFLSNVQSDAFVEKLNKELGGDAKKREFRVMNVAGPVEGLTALVEAAKTFDNDLVRLLNDPRMYELDVDAESKPFCLVYVRTPRTSDSSPAFTNALDAFSARARNVGLRFYDSLSSNDEAGNKHFLIFCPEEFSQEFKFPKED